MADADHHAVGRQIAGEGEVLIMLRCQRDIADVAPGRFLVVLELLDGGFDDVLVRLCALVLHVEIGAFEVDAQDLCAVVAALHDIGHVGDTLVSTSTLWVMVVARKLVTPSETMCSAQ